MNELEKQIKEAQDFLAKLREDIDQFTAKRSKLQNEIEMREKESLDKIFKRVSEAESDISIKYAELKKAEKFQNESIKEMAEALKIRTNTVIDREKEFQKKLADFDQKEADYLAQKEAALKNIDKLNREFEAKNKVISDAQQELKSEKVKLTVHIQDITEKTFRLEQQKKEVDKCVGELAQRQAVVENTLSEIRRQTEALSKERAATEAALGETKIVRTENSVLLAELAKTQTEITKIKADMDAESEALSINGKAIELRQEAVAEREISVSEKERLIVIESRKLDEKISTLKKLREEIK